MQNWIVGYVDQVRKKQDANGHETLGQSCAVVLKAQNIATLIKIRDAAIDLQRIADLALADKCETTSEEL